MTSELYNNITLVLFFLCAIPAIIYILFYIITSTKRTWRSIESLPLLIFPSVTFALLIRSFLLEEPREPLPLIILIAITIAMWTLMYMLFTARHRRFKRKSITK